MRHQGLWLGGVAALAATPAFGQLMIPDSGTGDRIMLFDAFDGSLIDANWLTDAGAVGWSFTTPKEALFVNGELWVSDQVEDAILRFDMAHNFLGEITAHPGGGVLDNLRGMGTDGSRVWLTVWPSDTSRRGVASYDTSGNALSFIPMNASLFDVEPFHGDLLISNSTSDNIERWGVDGAFINNFATGVDFPEQVALLPDGSVLAVSSIASMGVEGVYHFEPDGSLRRFIDTQELKDVAGELVPRGVAMLGDGNYLISTSIGIFKYFPDTNTYEEMLGGVSGQHISLIPAPGAAALLALGGLAAGRRRRR